MLIRAAFLLLLPALALADEVACHATYGGEERVFVAPATTSPYTVASTPLGSYFLFRVVFTKEPADLAAIKVYVYADRNEGPTPLHEAVHPYPPPAAKPPYGFTGLNFVYEPVRDGELQYWCELR